MIISEIVSTIYKNTKTNSVSYPASDMLVDINNAYNRVASVIIKANAKWQWSDTNNTDLDIATTALVASQRDYTIALSFLEILQARVKDSSGNWTKLLPKNVEDQDYQDTIDSTATGLPKYYDKSGTSVFLGPIPNYSQAASLEITFQRGPASFTSGEVTTGTKQPGFNSLYHELIPLWVSYDYWLVNDVSQARGFFTKIQMLESEIRSDYAGRNKDERNGLRPAYQNNK